MRKATDFRMKATYYFILTTDKYEDLEGQAKQYLEDSIALHDINGNDFEIEELKNAKQE